MPTLQERIAAKVAARGETAQVTQRPSLQERIAAKKLKRDQQAESPVEPTVAPVDPDSASSAIGRAVDNLQSTFGGAVETVGELTGSEYLQESGSQFRKEQLDEAAQYGAPSIGSYKQVDFYQPEQVGEYLKQMGLSALPGTGAVVASGAAGAKLGSMAGPVGATVGGIIGALTTAIPMNIGEVQNAMKEIDPEAKSPWSAVLGGTAISGLDILGLTSIAKPLVRTLGKDMALQALKEQGVAKEAAIHAIKGAVSESTTEATQEGVKAVAAAQGTDTNVNTEKLIEDAINGAVGGGLIGGGAGGISGGVAANEQNQYVAGTAAPVSKFEEGRKAPLNMAQRAWDALGSESTAMLEPMARNSGEIKNLIQKFRPDMSGATASDKTIFEDHELMVGKWRKMLEDGLHDQDVDVAINEYLDGQSSKGADAIRKTMADVLSVAKTDAGLNIGQIQDYLPTRLDEERISSNAAEFINDVAPYVSDPTKALNDWMTQQSMLGDPNAVPKVDRAVSQDPVTGEWKAASQYRKKGDPESFKYKFSQGTVPPEFGHLERSRAFGKVPQKVLQKWTKEQSGSEVMEAVRDYLEGAAHRIAFAKEFGPSGEKLNFKIVKGISEAQKSGYNPSKQEVDRMYDLLDAYNGMYYNLKTQGAKNVQAGVMLVSTMKALPLTLLSSLVETLTPAIRGDVKTAILEILPTVSQIAQDAVRQVFRSTPRTEFSALAADANITLGASLNIAAERLGSNAMTRGTAKGMKWFFMLNGLSFWTHFLSVYTAKVADSIYHKNLYELSRGVPITSPKGSNMANQLRSMGVPVYTNEDAQIIFNPITEAQKETSRAYRTLAIRRFKDQTVLEPNIADTPMWMSNGHIQWLAMLKRYPAAFGNIVLPQLLRRVTPSWTGSRTQATKGLVSSMFIITLILFVGYLQDELKMYAKGTKDTDKRTDEQRAMDVFNSTLSPLQVGLMMDFAAAPRYGSSPVESALGVPAGIIKEVGNSIYQFEKDQTEGTIWKMLYKQSPLGFSRDGQDLAEDIDLFD